MKSILITHLRYMRSYELQSARLLCPWNSPGKNTGVDCHSLLQGIFPTQGSNLGLLPCRMILYHMSHQGSLAILIVCLLYMYKICKTANISKTLSLQYLINIKILDYFIFFFCSKPPKPNVCFILIAHLIFDQPSFRGIIASRSQCLLDANVAYYVTHFKEIHTDYFI